MGQRQQVSELGGRPPIVPQFGDELERPGLRLVGVGPVESMISSAPVRLCSSTRPLLDRAGTTYQVGGHGLFHDRPVAGRERVRKPPSSGEGNSPSRPVRS